MKTISNTDLVNVTGGKSPNTSGLGGGGGTSSGGGSENVLSALQGIQSSLKDLGKPQQNGLFGGQNGLLFMTMALAMRPRASEVHVHQGRRGYSWSASW